MKNKIYQFICSLIIGAMLTACGGGTSSDPSADASIIPTEATFSAIIDGNVEVTLPISQLGLAEADLSGASMLVYRNDVLWDYDLDASVLYNTDNLSLYFVLVQMEAGDDVRVEITTSDGRTATYTGTISDTVDFTADVSSSDMPVTAGTDATNTGNVGDSTTDEIDPLYLITISQIDANGEVVVSFNFNVLDPETEEDYSVMFENNAIDSNEEYKLSYDEVAPFVDENGMVSLVFHNVSDQDQYFSNIYTLDRTLYVGEGRFSATETQEFDMTPNWLSYVFIIRQNK